THSINDSQKISSSWYCLQAAAVVLGLLVALIYPWVALGLAIALFFGYVLGEWLAIRRSPPDRRFDPQI
ncbi:MAG: hypothetical protein ACJ8F7_13215, partial [Gemmataceae bacterium]